MDKLDFRAVSLDDIDRIYQYTSRYGEGSCQHSPVSMWSLSEKYRDEICIRDDTLYVLRRNLCDDERRVYLAPLGEDSAAGFGTILRDAAAYGCKAAFITLTGHYAEELERAYPGAFDITEERDLAEYMYDTRRMANYSGRALRKRRSEANTFWNIYGDHASVELITGDDHADILEFEYRWVEQSRESHDEDALLRESRMIERQLSNFDALGLSGIVLRIDGEVQGFGYGVKLSDTHYDAIAEKGNRNITHIYKVLRRESVRQCAMDCTYVNMEEDVGIPGLRALKLAYKPEYLLKKYIAVQR